MRWVPVGFYEMGDIKMISINFCLALTDPSDIYGKLPKRSSSTPRGGKYGKEKN